MRTLRRLLIPALLLLALAAGATHVSAQAVGTVTLTSSSNDRGEARYVYRWTSDGAGNVSGTELTVKAGSLVQVTAIPDSGATQPDPLYDLSIYDTTELDVLGGAMQNEANTAPHLHVFNPPIFNRSTLEVRVSGAGAANSGQLVVIIR